MNSKSKRQRREVGDFVEISLDDKYRAYARVLAEATFAFYDSRSDRPLEIQEIVSKPILFKIPVMNHAVTRGRWKVIGHLPLEKDLEILPRYFMQDILKPERFSIYHVGKITPATKSECVGLECMAVWDPTHVEDRLRDHYAGKSNKWYESLKIREPKK